MICPSCEKNLPKRCFRGNVKICLKCLQAKTAARRRYNLFILRCAFGKGCACCGSEDNLAIDHLFVPKSHGGKLSFGNMAPLCRICNSRKGNRPWHRIFPSDSLLRILLAVKMSIALHELIKKPPHRLSQPL